MTKKPVKKAQNKSKSKMTLTELEKKYGTKKTKPKAAKKSAPASGETLADLEAMFASKNKGKKKRFREWHRTIILLALLGASIAFMMWVESSYQSNFIDSF